MLSRIFGHAALLITALHAQEIRPPTTDDAENLGTTETPRKPENGPPATLATGQLREFSDLPEDRRKIIADALAEAIPGRWLRYRNGGADPAGGGLDCSGAMYYVLRKSRMEPPRTAMDQYLWLEKQGRLRKAAPHVEGPDDPFFRELTPGDLLFWGNSTSSDEPAITHVAMYLGREKKDGRQVMINATDGRSYRGKRANGYGVYDFQLPRDGAKARFMGYGTPPGIRPAFPIDSPEPAALANSAWEAVKTKISVDDAALSGILEQQFSIGKQIVQAGGNAKTPPFFFDAIRKTDGGKVRMELSRARDFQITRRYQVAVSAAAKPQTSGRSSSATKQQYKAGKSAGKKGKNKSSKSTAAKRKKSASGNSGL